MLKQFAVVAVEDLVLANAHQVKGESPASHCLEKFQLSLGRAGDFALLVFDGEGVLIQNDFSPWLLLEELQTPGDETIRSQVDEAVPLHHGKDQVIVAVGTFFVSSEAEAVETGLLVSQASLSLSGGQIIADAGLIFLGDLVLNVGHHKSVSFENEKLQR